MLKLLLFLFAAIIWSQTNAQNSGAKISGQVLDSENRMSIGFVHVHGSQDQVVSDHLGQFSISVQIGDTLTFSHINFERYSVQILSLPDGPMNILLSSKENVMQEIIIHEYLLEEELKQEIIEHEVQITTEEVNAVNNVAQSTILYKKGYVPEMNSLDNFKNYLKEPQGVTLFSSDPNKGLMKSIKKLNQQNINLNGLNLNHVKNDTLSNKLFFVPIK